MLRVLQLAPLWETVPPPAYGGTEAVVSLLCEELVRRGVYVELWASGDSRSSARLRSIYPRSLRTDRDVSVACAYEWRHAGSALAEAGRFDIVHNHAGELPMALSGLVQTPMLTTMHCLIVPDMEIVWNAYDGWYNTISHSQREDMPPVTGGRFAGVVHNAIDVDTFPFQTTKEDYLLYLSRISPEKGPHVAVEVARRAGMRLVMAGKVDPRDEIFFEDVVQPLIDDEQVVYLGEADGRLKRELYRNARCLLAPLQWEEPFGLFLCESMACGTPVVALRRGAVCEIVADGETGFVVDTVDEMTSAVRQVGEIDPSRCREHVAFRFSPDVMVDGYLDVYRRLLDQDSTPRALSRGAPVAANAREDDRESLAIA
jgi:glycosyltransferase involved in cell wall biosynthesis